MKAIPIPQYPPRGSTVLLWCTLNKQWFTGSIQQEDGQSNARLESQPPTGRIYITYWMPLPPNPEGYLR